MIPETPENQTLRGPAVTSQAQPLPKTGLSTGRGLIRGVRECRHEKYLISWYSKGVRPPGHGNTSAVQWSPRTFPGTHIFKGTVGSTER